MSLTIVPLRETPSLQDIPALLRNLAAEIESGETMARTMFILIPRDGDYPQIRGWGDVDGDRRPIEQLALASHWLVSRQTDRGS
jgi:hypothetical protein